MGQALPGLWRGTLSSPFRAQACVTASEPCTPRPAGLPTPSPHVAPCGALSAWPLGSHHALHTRVPMHRLFPGAGGRTAVALRSALVPGVGPTAWLGPEESLPDG